MSTKPLWRLGLDWLVEAIADSTHPLDRDRARRVARGMRMVGQDPPYHEVSKYVGGLWANWPYTAAMVRECWRSVNRARTSLGRDTGWERTPLYEADLLIERHGLRPVTEDRLADVMHTAVDALMQAAPELNTAMYLARRRELEAAIVAVHHLRYLRQGSGALGFDDPNPEPPRRPKWW